ncbi:MAG: hypothetical protein ACKVT1_10735 [Dehalococcoidia bacterium]
MEALLAAGRLSESELRTGRTSAAGLYRGLSARTLTRDIELLQALRFLTVSGDVISPNYDLMDAYTHPDF